MNNVTKLHGIIVLPWLRPTKSFEVGRYVVAPLSAMGALGYAPSAVVRAILGTYVGLGDIELDPVLMWPKEASPFDVDPDSFTLSQSYVRCLALAAMAENFYFTDGEPPLCSPFFDAYYQRFGDDLSHVTIQKRRGDGATWDAWPVSKIRFPIPLAASVGSRLRFIPSFLRALVDGIASSDEVDQHIQHSLPYFMMANQMSEPLPVQPDLVWLGAAFENLFGVVDHGKARQIRSALVRSFSDASFDQAPDWQDSRGRTQSGTWLEHWAMEFYDHRSAIHGQPPATSTWDDYAHGLIGTMIYCLAVKLLLKEKGKYSLIEGDIAEVEALNDRLKCCNDLSSAEQWSNARRNADRKRTMQRWGGESGTDR